MKAQLKHYAVASALIAVTGLAMAPSATAVNPGPPPSLSSSAMAIDCTQYGTDQDPGYATFREPSAVRRGPAAECPNLGNRSGTFYIWCKKFNYLGNLWYYGRDASSNVVGWVYSGNFSRVYNSNQANC